MVLKTAALRENNPNPEFKHRPAFQRNNVVNQDWTTTIFKGPGSAPAPMDAGKLTDPHPAKEAANPNKLTQPRPTCRPEPKGTRHGCTPKGMHLCDPFVHHMDIPTQAPAGKDIATSACNYWASSLLLTGHRSNSTKDSSPCVRPTWAT